MGCTSAAPTRCAPRPQPCQCNRNTGAHCAAASTASHQDPSTIMAVVPQKPMTLISSVLQWEGGVRSRAGRVGDWARRGGKQAPLSLPGAQAVSGAKRVASCRLCRRHSAGLPCSPAQAHANHAGHPALQHTRPTYQLDNQPLPLLTCAGSCQRCRPPWRPAPPQTRQSTAAAPGG